MHQVWDVEVIIFDWGGTLSDVSRQAEALQRGSQEVCRLLAGTTDPDLAHALALEALAAERRAEEDPEHREVDLTLFLTAWAGHKGYAIDAGRLDAAIEAIGRCWVGALTPMPGAVEAVTELRDRGFRLGLVSNVWLPPKFCRQELQREGFGQLLDFAVFSSEVGFRKPSPAIYEAALQAAFPDGRPADLSRALFVGDSPSCDVIAPARLGMKTVLVDSVRGLWGETDYAAACPDFRVRSVADLPAALGGQGPGGMDRRG